MASGCLIALDVAVMRSMTGRRKHALQMGVPLEHIHQRASLRVLARSHLQGNCAYAIWERQSQFLGEAGGFYVSAHRNVVCLPLNLDTVRGRTDGIRYPVSAVGW
jgi:hypothetical protein